MGAAPDHLDQARRNREMAYRLIDTWPTDRSACEWAVTLAFYCAVHCIEAHLKSEFGIDCENHTDRDAVMVSDGMEIPRDVRHAYRNLYGLSPRRGTNCASSRRATSAGPSWARCCRA